jgi:hypothetical protein
MADFSNADVTVTLKGEEWFALIASMANKSLSSKGVLVLARAKTSLVAQVIRASNLDDILE